MYTYKVKEINRVVDGDTVDITIDLGFGLTKKERVRVAGIDTPESRTRDLYEKKLGKEAAAFLESQLQDDIIIKTEKEGKYGRMLGWLFKENLGCSINELMIHKGYAWPYDGGKKEKSYEELKEKRIADGSWIE